MIAKKETGRKETRDLQKQSTAKKCDEDGTDHDRGQD
jgi:hypothetical protein